LSGFGDGGSAVKVDHESHPFNKDNPIPAGTRILIVGTAPPQRFSSVPGPDGDLPGDVRFFYGSRDNELWWEILPALTGRKFNLENVTASRQAMTIFLENNRIWMHDICEKYRRTKAGSALDNNLCILETSNFGEVLRAYPSIEHIVFTGCRAERETCRYLVREGLTRFVNISGKMPRSRKVELHDGRSLRVHAVPSPSPMTARAGMTRGRKIAIYRSVLEEPVQAHSTICPHEMSRLEQVHPGSVIGA